MNDDLVSRQLAIDTVEESRRLNHHQDGKEARAHEYEHRHFLRILRDLPPAESDTVDKIDELIHGVGYLLDVLRSYRDIIHSGSCNDCQNRKCGYCPEAGQLVRYNCPFWEPDATVSGK